jgi:hypothetical protein
MHLFRLKKDTSIKLATSFLRCVYKDYCNWYCGFLVEAFLTLRVRRRRVFSCGRIPYKNVIRRKSDFPYSVLNTSTCMHVCVYVRTTVHFITSLHHQFLILRKTEIKFCDNYGGQYYVTQKLIGDYNIHLLPEVNVRLWNKYLHDFFMHAACLVLFIFSLYLVALTTQSKGHKLLLLPSASSTFPLDATKRLNPCE